MYNLQISSLTMQFVSWLCRLLPLLYRNFRQNLICPFFFCWDLIQKTLAIPTSSNVSHFYSSSFIVSHFTFGYQIFFESILYIVRESFYSFAYGHPVFLAWFIEATVPSPVYIVVTFVKSILTVDVWIYFWIIYSVPLIYVSVFMTVPCCLGYKSFVVCFEVRYYDVSSFILSVQDFFGYQGAFVIQYEFQDYFFCS